MQIFICVCVCLGLSISALVFAADGAVAPVLKSSFQPGSMSDTANKPMSPSATPPSPTSGKLYCLTQSLVHVGIFGLTVK